MKLMIASDLHGSAYYVDLLLQRWQEEKAERLILLGDILYHGPRNALPRDYDTKAAADLLMHVYCHVYGLFTCQEGIFLCDDRLSRLQLDRDDTSREGR